MSSRREKLVGDGRKYGTYAFLTNGVTGTTWTNNGDSYYRYAHVGYDVENYTSLRKAGEIIPMTYWHQIECEGAVTADLNITRAGPGWSQAQTLAFGNGNTSADALCDVADVQHFTPYLTEDLDAQVYVDEAAARVYSSGWDISTFLAELGKTANMVRNVGKSLYNLTKEWSTVSQQTKVTLDAWLQGRYGWRILIYDIIDVENAIRGISEKQRKRFSNRCGRSVQCQNVLTVPYYWGHANHVLTITESWDISARGTIIADIRPPKLRANPVLTAWELIPYSFVIDWFLGIGTWLERLTFLTMATRYAAAAGKHVSYTRTLDNHAYSFPKEDAVQIAWQGTHTLSLSGSGSLTVRTPATVSNLPHFNIRLDGYKVLDLLALTFQVLRRS